MSDPVRDIAIAAVTADLAAIVPDPEYAAGATVVTVSEDKLTPNQFAGRLPGIAFVDKGETFEAVSNEEQIVWIGILLFAYIIGYPYNSSDPRANARRLNVFHRDIFTAMVGPGYRIHGGDPIITTEYQGFDTIDNVAGEAVCGMGINFRVLIKRTWSVP